MSQMEAEQIWESLFGADLFNLYSLRPSSPRFHARIEIVKAMIQTMVEKEKELENGAGGKSKSKFKTQKRRKNQAQRKGQNKSSRVKG